MQNLAKHGGGRTGSNRKKNETKPVLGVFWCDKLYILSDNGLNSGLSFAFTLFLAWFNIACRVLFNLLWNFAKETNMVYHISGLLQLQINTDFWQELKTMWSAADVVDCTMDVLVLKVGVSQCVGCCAHKELSYSPLLLSRSDDVWTQVNIPS